MLILLKIGRHTSCVSTCCLRRFFASFVHNNSGEFVPTRLVVCFYFSYKYFGFWTSTPAPLPHTDEDDTIDTPSSHCLRRQRRGEVTWQIAPVWRPFVSFRPVPISQKRLFFATVVGGIYKFFFWKSRPPLSGVFCFVVTATS